MPSDSFSAPSLSCCNLSLRSSNEAALSTSSFEKISFDTTVTEVVISKSLTSASTSKLSGISTSSPSISSSARLSFSPGNAIPTTISLSPSEITLPFLTSTFTNFPVSRTAALAAMNGTQISFFSPFISAVVRCLLLYVQRITRCPLLPLIFSGETSCPSRKYSIVTSTGSSLSDSPL